MKPKWSRPRFDDILKQFVIRGKIVKIKEDPFKECPIAANWFIKRENLAEEIYSSLERVFEVKIDNSIFFRRGKTLNSFIFLWMKEGRSCYWGFVFLSGIIYWVF